MPPVPPAAAAADHHHSPAPPAQQPFWQRWAARRRPRGTDTVLHHRHLYVLPTGAGWMLGLTLLVLLLGAINFQLNLGYMLTFWLLGCAVASVGYAHRNVRGLHLQLGPLAPVHAGQTAVLPVQLQAPGKRTRWALSLATKPQPALPRKRWAWSHCDVPAGSAHTAELGWVCPQRGWHPVPTVVLESLYPLGVCRVWSTWQPTQLQLVYPQPEHPCPPLPHPSAHADAPQQPRPLPGHEQRDNIRPYQAGDGLRDVVWKKAAQTWATDSGELVVRHGQQAPSANLWLHAQHTGLSAREAQISRLTAWVLQAHAQQARWGLQLPSGAHIAPSSGPEHLQACLRALALDGLPTPTTAPHRTTA